MTQPEPTYRIRLEPCIEGLKVEESSSDSQWAKFDEAWRQTRDGVTAMHEEHK